MTETIPTNPPPETQGDGLLHLIVFLLAPLFLTASDGDIAFARAAALETVNSYQARNSTDLIAIGQIIAYGLAALGSLSLSMADDLSLSMTLRLRGNATALTRAAEQNRRALRQDHADAAPHRQAAAETPFSEPDQAFEDSVLASVAAARQATAEGRALSRAAAEMPPISLAAEPAAAPCDDRSLFDQARTGQIPTAQASTAQASMAQASMAQASGDQPSGDQPPAAQSSTAQASMPQPSTAQNQADPVLTERQRQAMWAAAMIDVAGEYTAELKNLPPAQRRAASMRAAALTTTAHNLISGAVPSQSGPAAFGSLARR